MYSAPTPQHSYEYHRNSNRTNSSLDRVVIVLCVVAGLLAAVIGATFVAQSRIPQAAAAPSMVAETPASDTPLSFTQPGVVVGGADTVGQDPNEPVVAPPAPTEAVELEKLPEGCDAAGGCEFGGNGLGLVADSDKTAVTLTDDGAAKVTGDVKIPTTGGDVEIPNADVEIEVDDQGNIVSVSGTSDIPLPTTGVFQHATIVDGARAEVGYDWGYNLTHLGAYVNPNRQYYYFAFEDSFSMSTGFDQMFGDVEGLPVSLSAPGDVSVTVVLDPLDPFFYIGGACPDFDSSNSDSNNSDPANVRVGGNGGEDCGFGASLGGFIPFTAQSPAGAGNLASFNGHMVVHHHAIPIQTGVFVEGEMVVRIGDDGLAFGANGDIYATVPLVGGVLDLSFPLGQASAGYQIGGANSTVDLFVSGSFASADALPEWLPVTPPNNGTAQAAARLVFDPSSPTLLGADSFLEVSGEMTTGAAWLSNLTGTPSEPMQTSSAKLRIDANGARLQGSTSANLFPNVRFGGEMSVDAYVSPVNPASSYVEIVGSVGIGGSAFEGGSALDGDVLLRLDANGVKASGHITTPVSRIAVEGIISATEVTLRGNASIDVGTSDIIGLLDKVADNDAAVAALDAEIDRQRAIVIAEREQVLTGLENALADKENAFNQAVKAVSDTQRAIDNLEDDFEDAIGPFIDWALDLIPGKIGRDIRKLRSDLDKAEDRLDDRLDERTRLSAAVKAAEKALSEYKTEIASFAVDLDPRVALLIADRALIEVGGAIAGGLSSIINIDARVQANIDVVLSTTGISGSMSGQVCSGSGCLELIGGSVSFDPYPEACFTVVGINACTDF